MRTVARLTVALALGVFYSAFGLAEVQQLAADGAVHRIDVELLGSGKTTGSALRHTKQKPRGGRESAYVPGTEDLTIDRDPAVEIDPASGTVVLVWSRYDGSSFNLFVSRLAGSTWSTPHALLRADGDDLEPQLRFGGGHLHVSWRQELGGQTSFYRLTVQSSTLTPAYGPERIPSNDDWATPPEGDATPWTPDPSETDQFFCGVSFSKVPGDPGRAFVWGVRDEPVPISYLQSFVLPADVRSASGAEAGWVGGRFTVWFVSGDRLYYTTRSDDVWSETLFVELVPGTVAADARWLVLQANSRTAPD